MNDAYFKKIAVHSEQKRIRMNLSLDDDHVGMV
jgi:hypothetical protein